MKTLERKQLKVVMGGDTQPVPKNFLGTPPPASGPGQFCASQNYFPGPESVGNGCVAYTYDYYQNGSSGPMGYAGCHPVPNPC